MTKKEIVETIKKMDNARVINLWNNYVEKNAICMKTIQFTQIIVLFSIHSLLRMMR